MGDPDPDQDPPVHQPLTLDARKVLLAQALRALVYGFGSVHLGIVLESRGWSTARIGVLLTCVVAGLALMTVLIGRYGDRIGRRRCYVGALRGPGRGRRGPGRRPAGSGCSSRSSSPERCRPRWSRAARSPAWSRPCWPASSSTTGWPPASASTTPRPRWPARSARSWPAGRSCCRHSCPAHRAIPACSWCSCPSPCSVRWWRDRSALTSRRPSTATGSPTPGRRSAAPGPR